MTIDLAGVPVKALSGVGPKLAEKLLRLQIRTVQDVLFHLPLRYQDRTREFAIRDLLPGREAVCSGVVQSTEVLMRRRRTLTCRISDGTGQLTLRFFHFNQGQQNALREGVRVRCFGEVRRAGGQLEMAHPDYQIDSGSDFALDQTLTPVYPVTEGLHQLSMRKITDGAINYLKQSELVELLPESTRAGAPAITLHDALMTVHRPSSGVDVSELLEGTHPAIQRLAFEELLAHRLSMRRLRQRVDQNRAPQIPLQERRLCEELIKSQPFSLTGAQQRVIEEIARDLGTEAPMLRLVQGDVGSGKTLVAAAAAALVVGAGYQVAVMAPTEILAEQHLLSFSNWFEPLGIKVGWLKGKLGARQRRDAIESIAVGQTDIAVGTHALFQQDVNFAKLGLTIVDEQHRFGVDQRLSLRAKGVSGNQVPHQLTMTATPIPRTLAMTAYADLDCSTIDELPPGRQEITTVAIPSSRRREVVERVGSAIADGRQVYWVCTLIEESEMLQASAAEDTAQELQEYLPDVAIALVHGRMAASDKETAMLGFKNNDTQLLVATTVIEVGVDVPNASLIIIENAERLGLSQLHQLRGRVGRGTVQSSCVLMYAGGLSQRSRERIAIMRETNDGFAIAEKDLDLRGAGEMLGTRQTGSLSFRIADLVRDKKLLPEVRDLAAQIGSEDPLADQLIERWIGYRAPQYGNV